MQNSRRLRFQQELTTEVETFNFLIFDSMSIGQKMHGKPPSWNLAFLLSAVFQHGFLKGNA